MTLFSRLGLLLLALFALASPAAAQEFPALTGRIVDQANLLSAQREAALTTKLETLEAQTGDQLVIVTLNDLGGEEIEDYGYQLGRAWGIGQSETDSGVLLIVAPNERKVRIEVGYGLEPVMTDALSALIIQEQILPAFKVGGFERGIEQGTDAIIGQLTLDRAEAEARAAAVERDTGSVDLGVLIPIGLIILFGLLSVIQSARFGGKRRYRRGGGLAPILIWGATEAMRSRGGGGFGGGGFGGGGFSGGGGGFGGGGASGGW